MGFAAPAIPMILGGLASAVFSSALSPDRSAPQPSAQPTPAAPAPTAQAPQAPQAQAALAPVTSKGADSAKTGGAPPPGANDTLLTGPAGAMAGSGQIGRNTILGG